MSIGKTITVFCECCGKLHKVPLDKTLEDVRFCKRCQRMVTAECSICHKKHKVHFYEKNNGSVCYLCKTNGQMAIHDAEEQAKSILDYLDSMSNPSLFRYANLSTWITNNTRLIKEIEEVFDKIEKYKDMASDSRIINRMLKTIVLIKVEDEYFSNLQKCLRSDIQNANGENYSFWQNILYVMEHCKTVIEYNNEKMECCFRDFPIAKSCCAAIKDFISDINTWTKYS